MGFFNSLRIRADGVGRAREDSTRQERGVLPVRVLNTREKYRGSAYPTRSATSPTLKSPLSNKVFAQEIFMPS